tara:strand:- start:2394 stop:2822 length:429 start_codon:yes stop_codon:yes gene_type:complete
MAITQALCTSFKEELLNKEHDMNTDTFKIALFTSSATLNATTTVYDSTDNEITGTGYSAGGKALASGAIAVSGTTAYVDFADPAWTSASFTCRGALIYNTSASLGTEAVAVLDFGGDFTVAAGTFTIALPVANASNALIRLA